MGGEPSGSVTTVSQADGVKFARVFLPMTTVGELIKPGVATVHQVPIRAGWFGGR